MTDIITLTGLVATTPRHITTSNGLDITSFRLATNMRRFDRGQNAWVDGDTNWYTVTALGQLGLNAALSLEKGQRAIVVGRLRQREWETTEGCGVSIEVEADSIGHDLNHGQTSLTRQTLKPRFTDDTPVSVAEPTA